MKAMLGSIEREDVEILEVTFDLAGGHYVGSGQLKVTMMEGNILDLPKKLTRIIAGRHTFERLILTEIDYGTAIYEFQNSRETKDEHPERAGI